MNLSNKYQNRKGAKMCGCTHYAQCGPWKKAIKKRERSSARSNLRQLLRRGRYEEADKHRFESE